VRDVSWTRTALATAFVVAAGGAWLCGATHGFRVFTSEQARRSSIARAPRALPTVRLEDQDGRAFTLAEYRGTPLLVDFVYTRCATVCPLLSASFQRLHRDSASAVALLSITFDSSDTPARLREYAARYHAGHGWRLARARDAADLRALLEAFGVVVIPDTNGGFQHNAAVHVVNRDGRLARVLDLDASAADAIRAAGLPIEPRVAGR